MERKGGRGKCAACADPRSGEINQALLTGSLSQSKIAAKFGITRRALQAHKKAHLSPALAKLNARRALAGATTAVARLERLVERLEGYVTAAEKAKNVHQALGAIRELRATIELLAKVTGELDERATTVVNIASSAEWIQVRTVVLKALRPYPPALRAVADGLERIA